MTTLRTGKVETVGSLNSAKTSLTASSSSPTAGSISELTLATQMIQKILSSNISPSSTQTYNSSSSTLDDFVSRMTDPPTDQIATPPKHKVFILEMTPDVTSAASVIHGTEKSSASANSTTSSLFREHNTATLPLAGSAIEHPQPFSSSSSRASSPHQAPRHRNRSLPQVLPQPSTSSAQRSPQSQFATPITMLNTMIGNFHETIVRRLKAWHVGEWGVEATSKLSAEIQSQQARSLSASPSRLPRQSQRDTGESLPPDVPQPPPKSGTAWTFLPICPFPSWIKNFNPAKCNIHRPPVKMSVRSKDEGGEWGEEQSVNLERDSRRSLPQVLPQPMPGNAAARPSPPSFFSTWIKKLNTLIRSPYGYFITKRPRSTISSDKELQDQAEGNSATVLHVEIPRSLPQPASANSTARPSLPPLTLWIKILLVDIHTSIATKLAYSQTEAGQYVAKMEMKCEQGYQVESSLRCCPCAAYQPCGSVIGSDDQA